MSEASKGKPKSQKHRDMIRRGTSGKPKPWQKGSNNVNYQNQSRNTPEAQERFLRAVRLRGQPWTERHKQQHSARMSGPSNAMRGKRHTPETIRAISETKRRQYEAGSIRLSRNKLSRAERNIANELRSNGVRFETQFHIKGARYLYDFFFPDYNLIIEYQGDYWHANPRHHPPGEFLKIQGKGLVRVEDIWARDLSKKETAELAGYTIAYIWESDYKVNGISSVYELITEKTRPNGSCLL